MIARTVGAALRFRVLLVAIAVAIVLGGTLQLAGASREVYPEFAPPTVEVQTEALGLSAAEVEQLITAPLEADLLNGVAWVDDIHSESVLGLSSVVLTFKPDTDLYRARQAVQERLAQAHALPNVSKPPQMLQPTSSTSRTMMVALTSDKLSVIELSQLARWTIKPRLQGVEGVANVASFGQRDRQLQIQVDPTRLANAGVGLQDVIEAGGNSLWVSPLTFLEASSPGTGGFLETQNQRLTVRHVSPIQSAADLAKVAIPGKPGLTLADVASVVEDHQPLIGDASVNGRPGVLLIVSKLPDANTVEVTNGVEAALAALKPAMRDITVDTQIYRPADYVVDSSNNLAAGALIALGLLIVALGAAFLRWRSAVVAIGTVLVSMSAAIAVLLARNTPLNLMVLGGLALGMAVMVDDAVAGTDRIVRRLRAENGRGTARPDVAIAAAVVELRGPLTFGAALAVLPVLPAFFMDDLFGYLGRPLAISYVIAVAVSTLVATLVAPALAALLLSRPGAVGERGKVARGLERRYAVALRRLLGAPRAPLAMAAVVGILAVAVVPVLGRSSLAPLSERDYLIELDAPAGTALPEMNRITGEISQRLRSTPGVREVAAHAGRAITGDQVANVNHAEMWVGLDRSADIDRTVTAMKAIVAAYPAVDTDVLTYQQFALKEINQGADGDLVVRVFGHNGDVLAAKATEVGDRLARIDGVSNLHVELPITEPTLEVKVDLEKAAAYGVKPGDVRRQAAALLAGIEVGALYYDQKVFEVIVYGAPAVRENPADVSDLLIETPIRGRVPLREVATITTVDSPNVIERDGAFRRIDITMNATGRSIGAVAKDVRRVLGETGFPLEYRAELLGDYVEGADDRRELLVLGGFALLAMLLLLQACFGSSRLSLGVFLALPASCLGGLVAAWVGGGAFSVGEVLGLLTLFVLTARAAVATVRRMQTLRPRADGPLDLDLVVRVARERFGPIVLTLGTVCAVLLPAAALGRRPGLEVLSPMAVVVLAGAVFSAAVSVFVVPAMCLLLGGKSTTSELDMAAFEEEERRRANGAQPALPSMSAAQGAGV